MPWRRGVVHDDGYQLMVRRTPTGIRIRARRGHDWSERYGWIVETAAKLRATSFVIDGQSVVLDQRGNTDFDRLHSRHDRLFVTSAEAAPVPCAWPRDNRAWHP